MPSITKQNATAVREPLELDLPKGVFDRIHREIARKCSLGPIDVADHVLRTNSSMVTQEASLLRDITKALDQGHCEVGIVTGPRGSGKSAFVRRVLDQYRQTVQTVAVIQIYGCMVENDRQALLEIARQLKTEGIDLDMEEAEQDEENIYEHIMADFRRLPTGCVLVIDDLDGFVYNSATQNLIYHLFNMRMAHNLKLYILGITDNYGDFRDAFEKRVASRFHGMLIRYVPEVSPQESSGKFTNARILAIKQHCRAILTVKANELIEPDVKASSSLRRFVDQWNESVSQCLSELSDGGQDLTFEQWAAVYGNSPCDIHRFLLQAMLDLRQRHGSVAMDEAHIPTLTAKGLRNALTGPGMASDQVKHTLMSLTLVEMLMLIAVKHAEFNRSERTCTFALVWDQYVELRSRGKINFQVKPETGLLAFEMLLLLGLVRHSSGYDARVSKEYIPVRMSIDPSVLRDAVKTFHTMPETLTAIVQ
eukprot:Clim_evm34s240 gene=Clim_evmTU34s240